MGYSSYSDSSRLSRASTLGYYSKSADDIFTQSKERKIHESMSPKNVGVRECRDSEAHPNTVPIILALDVTGSMRSIPHHLVKDGLPTLMSGLIQKGCKDASLLFLAIGDHECDRYPLQVGQFESGDEELDMWLTRTYLEGGGGGNEGESYFLTHYFASRHTMTDSFSKRNIKGFLFTIGDEPFLKKIPVSAIKEIMGNDEGIQSTIEYQSILEECKKMYNVYHFHVTHDGGNNDALKSWKNLLGQNCIEVMDYTLISNMIADIVSKHSQINVTPNVVVDDKTTTPQSEEML